MRFTSIVLTGAFALLASAQSTTSVSSAASTTIDAAQASQSAAQAEILKCLEACKAGDVACTSKCIAVPNPSDSQVNATNTCVANCPQGKGSESDIAAYQKCVEDCIGANYFTATAGTPSPTSSSGSDSNNNNGGSNNNNGDGSSSGSGSDSGNSNPSSTSGNSPSGTGSNAAATSTGAAAQLMQVSGSAVGILGFLAAVMAL